MTPESQKAYQFATSIFGQVVNAFSPAQQPSLVTKSGTPPLQTQLQTPTQQNPMGIGAVFSGLSDLLDFTGMIAHGDALPLPGDPLGKVAAFLKAVLSAQTPQALQANMKQGITDLITIDPMKDLALLPAFIKGQLSVALSVASILRKLPDPAIPKAIETAYITYLFDEKGFQTIDGDSIAPPTHLSSFANATLSADLKMLKDAVSEKNGVRYVRDLVRLPVEAACDVAYQLEAQITEKVGANFPSPATQAAGRAKLIRWMKGFASMAEAGVTGAIEEASAGVGPLQTNPLIAAATGTFGGTWARKVTQEVFLRVI